MRPAFHRLSLALLAALAACGAALAALATTPAVVHKPSVDVRRAPEPGAPAIATLRRDAKVGISAQEGLWYRLELDDGRSGYVRVNEVRMAHAGTAAGAGAPALLGRAGRGRVTETATVRGIDASDLAGGRHDARGLERMERHRVDAATAAAHAASRGWQARRVPWADEAAELDVSGPQATQAEKRGGLSAARVLLSKLGGAGGMLGDQRVARVADRAVGKSAQEVAEEERALGPAVTGRVLGVAPLWNDDAAQRRVNLVGRWVASQTSRPGLPWTFGVIDDGEINAYAAPGGYVLLTRGLYGILDGDDELAAVLAHEIGHVVQRDHFEVIRRQQLREAGKDAVMSEVSTPGAAAYARDYVDRHGAAVLLSGLDREAEYRADHAAGVYLARAGFDPLAFYSVLQKMASLGTRPARLAQLYSTHPPLDQRMDRLDAGSGRGRRRR